MDNSWKTAIARIKPSRPVQWVEKRWQTLNNDEDTLFDHVREGGLRILDYGCGRGFDAFYMNADRYDPHWFPLEPAGPYNIIFCTYVLNVVERSEREKILDRIDGLLGEGGVSYVTVRRDVDFFNPVVHDGYCQWYVFDGDMKKAGYHSVHKTREFEIYVTGGYGDY